MAAGRQFSDLWKSGWIFSCILLCILASCTVPRRYQKDTPFVYKTEIDIHSPEPLEGDVKHDLKDQLYYQLDDSLKVRTVLAVRIIPPFFYYRLNNPPVFDTSYLSRSKSFMHALLNSRGFFNAHIEEQYHIDTIKDQQRVHIRFQVNTEKVYRLDSIGYQLSTPEFQELAGKHIDASLLKKGEPYSLSAISSELDRLLTLYRNNGYYKVTKEDLVAEHDTVAAALINPLLDPFEQLLLLDSLSKRRDKPTIDVTIRQRPSRDSSSVQKYYIGDITVYPDHPYFGDSSGNPRETLLQGYKIMSYSGKFKEPFIARNIFLKPGGMYRVNDYFRTLNTFNNIGAWQQVIIDLNERKDSVNLLDAVIRLYPMKQYSLNIDVESSLNASDVLATGYLFGVGLNLGLNNRNAFREGIQTSTNLRTGVELGAKILQTAQTSINHSIYIPRFILPFGLKTPEKFSSPKTIANIYAAYTDRRNFFTAKSLNGSWGYEWIRRNESNIINKTWQYIPLNIEYTAVDKTDSLLRIEDANPTVRYAFNDGLIISQVISYSVMKAIGNNNSIFRVRFEESGALSGLVRQWAEGDLYRFLKGNIEYKYYINRASSTWAFRIFGGYGITYGTLGNDRKNTLPFFKAYFGGGPYSMRAWRIRQLGLGSNTYFDTVNNNFSLDRFGDIQLEGNIEYRFDLGRLFGVKVQSALFTDFGNVWRRNTGGDPNLAGSEFNINRLYTDLAVAGGTSLRFDLDFFLIRFDYAWKLKDPFNTNGSPGWFHDLKLKNGQFQLGIGYPF